MLARAGRRTRCAVARYFRRSHRTRIPHPANHPDRPLARRRAERRGAPRHCRAGGKASRPADRDRQPRGWRRIGRTCDDGGHRKTRRLHLRADAGRDLSRAADAEVAVGSGEGFHLHHRPLCLRLRPRRSGGRALQDLEGHRRPREAKSRQADIRHAWSCHLAAHGHGKAHPRIRREAHPCAVQGLARGEHGGGRRPCEHGRIGLQHQAAGRRRQDPHRPDVDQSADKEFSRRANAARGRLSPST